MAHTVILVASLVATIGSGLVAGVFFAFSTTVMASLRTLPARYGIAAMQSINARILNPRFVGVFMLTTVASAVLVVNVPFAINQPGAIAQGVAGLVYLVVVFGITFGANIPLNKKLDRFDPASQEAARFWEDHFFPRWMAWHYLRTIAAAAVTTALTITIAQT